MTQADITHPLTVFFAYSHQDEKLLVKFRQHLAPLRRDGLISEWYDRKILAGQEWEPELDKHLETSDLVILIVSSSFIDSDYCYLKEMDRALQRNASGEAIVIPVIIRPVEWQSTPLGKLQAVPRDGKPGTMWSNRDSAWFDAAKQIRERILIPGSSMQMASTAMDERSIRNIERNGQPVNEQATDDPLQSDSREIDTLDTASTHSRHASPSRIAVIPFFRAGTKSTRVDSGEGVYLVIGNYGDVAAIDVEICFIDSIVNSSGQVVSSTPSLARPIPVLKPGEEHQYFIDQYHDLQLDWGIRAAKDKYRIEVSATDAITRTRNREVHVISLGTVFPIQRAGPWTDLAGNPVSWNDPRLPRDADPHPANLVKEPGETGTEDNRGQRHHSS